MKIAVCVAVIVIAPWTSVSPASAQTAPQPVRLKFAQAVVPVPSPSPDTRPRVPLTLDDAVKLALDRNLDIAVQRLNPQTFALSLASLQAVYKPTLTSQLSTQSQTNPSTSTIAGATAGTGITQGLNTVNGGIAQSIPWGGGSFAATLNNSRTTTTAGTALYNPSYTPNWSAQYAAAASRLLDRHDPGADRDHQAQPGHFRAAAPLHDHQHGVERAERLLGLRVRRPVGGCRAAIGLAGRRAGLEQPAEGSDRHHGADRRRIHKADAVGRPARGAGRGPGHDAHGGSRAEAADRRRPQDPNWTARLDQSIGRSSRWSPWTSRPPPARRSVRGPT